MNHRKINRLFALAAFLVPLAAYLRTLSPTVVFWDVGEFCAAAFSLQIPHPPGAPLFLLLARISSMIPFASDIAVRMHFLSALGSASACGLLYLIIADLMVLWKGKPANFFDGVVIYSSSIIGALSMAFSVTFWLNAIEAEVYGLSMTFIGLIIYIGLRWYERPEEESGDRYILLIAYILGISAGVHLLSLLAIFPVMFLWYFRNNEFDWKSIIKFGIGGLVIFLIIYPGIVLILPSLLDGEFIGIKNQAITYVPIVLILASIYGLYYSARKKKRLLNVAMLSFLLIILGISTYTLVYIRANSHPPMNENDPSTLGRLVSYLNREQYGNAPVFNRRWDSDPLKKHYHKNYGSDLDYMWRYQINHMYFRYLGWNFIGAKGDFRNAGVDWKQYYMIPFLLGLLGIYFQWRKQPNISVTMILSFLIMGVILALYQNQQEPQPRERDYFYVGSFFIFSIWIAYGVHALVDLSGSIFSSEKLKHTAIYTAIVLAFIFAPLNMFVSNFHQANRSKNYSAWDFSYNMLQSCAKDAILITNGDNDTFPLWYLQDVEGIRRDIRIVNLSLANTPWYIRQLKHEAPFGAKAVPISSSDEEIEKIRAMRFEPRWMELPVSPYVIQNFISEGSHDISQLDTSIIRNNVIRFLMPCTIKEGNIQAVRAQDIILYDIIISNNWRRPIYFSTTVSDECKIGLHDYMQLNGLTFKLSPFKTHNYWSNINEQAVHENIFNDIKQVSKEQQFGYLWRGLQDSTIYYDEDTRRMLNLNYRNMFISYAVYCGQIKHKPEKIEAILDRMEQVLPRRAIQMDYRLKHDLASIYLMGGSKVKYDLLLNEIISELRQTVSKPVADQLSQYNPFIFLFYCYIEKDMYKDAEDILPLLKSNYPTDPRMDQIIQQLKNQIQMKKASSAAARQNQSKN